MRPGPLLLLQLALAVAGLTIYHLARSAPAAPPVAVPSRADQPPEEAATPDPVLEERARELDAFERRLAALETGVYELRAAIADTEVVAHSGTPKEDLLSDARLDALEAQVTVVEQRRRAERRAENLRIGIKELKQGLTPIEIRTVVEIIQRSHVELGAFGKMLRDEKIYDPQKNLEGYDKIRKRYHKELRDLLTPEQAEAVIERFIALR